MENQLQRRLPRHSQDDVFFDLPQNGSDTHVPAVTRRRIGVRHPLHTAVEFFGLDPAGNGGSNTIIGLLVLVNRSFHNGEVVDVEFPLCYGQPEDGNPFIEATAAWAGSAMVMQTSKVWKN